MATRFILIRHGQTEWNQGAERFRGRADVPLNETGRAQAQRIAARLAVMKIAAIYASPMQRTLHTAQPLADVFHLPAQAHPGLLDLDFGAIEGLTLDEARQAYPKVIEKWIATPGQTQFPKGEAFRVLRSRLMALADELTEKHAGENVALVTHRIVAQALLCIVLGLVPNALWRVTVDNGAISMFEKRSHGWVVRTMNDTSHLDGLA